MSKFKSLSGISLIGKGVTPGVKTFQSSKPELITDLGVNKFTINAKVAQMMGLAAGDYIYMIDAGVDATDMNDRFYICKGFMANGKMQGAKLATTSKEAKENVRLSFSYSRVWGAMLNNELEVSELTPTDMLKKGLVQEYVTEADAAGKHEGGNLARRALKRLYYEVEPVTDEEGNAVETAVFQDNDGNVIEVPVFILTKGFFKDVDEKDVEEDKENQD
jgi:hypothetical protein